MNTLIITGGSININFLKKHIEENTYDCIIAVDKGLEIADSINIIPNHIVGDLDSLNHSILPKYDKHDVIFHKYSPEKDYTDTDIAIKLAIDLNSTEITIIGATGTRIDHTLANIHILCNTIKYKIPTKIIDENNIIYLITSKTILQKQNAFGNYISLIPLTTTVKGLCLNGFKYPLYNHDLTIGKSLGISNEITEDTASIDFKDGILIVIESKD